MVGPPTKKKKKKKKNDNDGHAYRNRSHLIWSGNPDKPKNKTTEDLQRWGARVLVSSSSPYPFKPREEHGNFHHVMMAGPSCSHQITATLWDGGRLSPAWLSTHNTSGQESCAIRTFPLLLFSRFLLDSQWCSNGDPSDPWLGPKSTLGALPVKVLNPSPYFKSKICKYYEENQLKAWKVPSVQEKCFLSLVDFII